MEKIKFRVPDSDESTEFYVLEQTKINGRNYLLVTEEEEGDCDAFILAELSGDEEDAEASYEMVESEEELKYLSQIFASVMEDVDFSL